MGVDYQYNDGEPHEVMFAGLLFGRMPEIHYTLTKDKLDSLKKKNFGPEINARQSPADWMTSRERTLQQRRILLGAMGCTAGDQPECRH